MQLLAVVHVCGSESFSAGVVLVWKWVCAGSMSRVGRAFFRAQGAYRTGWTYRPSARTNARATQPPRGQVFGGKVVFRHDDCSSGLGASDLTRGAKLVVAGRHARHSCSQHLRVRPPAGEAVAECRYPQGARIPFRLH